MKIVCIAGHCVSGKSTAIEIMEQYLPNSIVVRSDNFLAMALLKHEKEFKEIYKIPLNMEKPYESLRSILNDSSAESVKMYRQLLDILAPFIENKIEKAVAEKKQDNKDFILVEYVMLPAFKIWEYADCRVMIVSDKELRVIKWRERAIAKGSYNENDCHHYTRENVLAEIIENASNIDFTVENKYDKNFQSDLMNLCEKLTLTK